MSENFELLRGSGNVFSDFGHADSDLEQVRAILAAEIIRMLDGRSLSSRAAEKLTGVAYSEFSRIRNAKLDELVKSPKTVIPAKAGIHK
jgi:predicted XRE-type DNA-binding protein